MADKPANMPLTVWVGPEEPAAATGTRQVTVTPTAATPIGIVDAVRASGLTPVDLRAAALVAFSPALDADVAVATYVALCVVAGRRIDAAVDDTVVSLASLHQTLSRVPATPPPPLATECLQVGATHPSLPSVTIDETGVSPEDLSLIRSARRVRLAVGSEPLASTLAAFTAVSALRSPSGMDRLPYLVAGSEPADPDPLDAGDLPAGFDLGTVRAGAQQLRRSHRPRATAGVAEAVAPSERLAALAVADRAPVALVLAALGVESPDGAVWPCTRPHLHTNGDANPSARRYGNALRCHRCDDEALGPVALVAASREVTVDEAASWIAAVVGDPPSAATSNVA